MQSVCIHVLFVSIHTYRSKDFRPAYGNLAELRSLLLPNTPYMACTATITKSVRKEVEVLK